MSAESPREPSLRPPAQPSRGATRRPRRLVRWTTPVVVSGTLSAIAFALWLVAWRRDATLGPLHGFGNQDLIGFSIFEAPFLLVTVVAQALLCGFLAVALRERWPAGLDRAFRALQDKPDVAYASLGGIAGGLALLIGLGFLDGHPISEDEKTYLLQTHLLLQGRLSAPVPPEAAAFWQPFVVISGGRWTGQYFWAQAVALIPGVLVGLPLLTSAIEVAVTVYFTGKLAEEYTGDRRAGVLASVLGASSPLLVFTASTLHNANLAAACAAAALWALARMARRSDPRAFITLGLAVGVGLHNRVGDQVVITLGGGILLAVHLWPDLSTLARRLGPAILVSLPLVALHPVVNNLAYGKWSTTGYALFNGGHGWKTMGFGIGPFGLPHTPEVAAVKTFTVFIRVAFHATGAPIALSLLAAPILGLRRSLRTLAPGVPLAVHALFYFFYTGTPIDLTGPVYYVAIAPILLGWLAMVALELHDRLRATPGLGRLVPAFLVAQAGAALLAFWPAQVGELYTSKVQASSCETALEDLGIRRGLVFMRSVHGEHEPIRTYHHRPPIAIPPFDAPLLFARTLGPSQDVKTALRFAGDRPIFFQRCLFSLEPAVFRYDPSRGIISALDGSDERPIPERDSPKGPRDGFDWPSMTWLDGSSRPPPAWANEP